jgi:biotin carboxyl carrier protein
VAVAEAAVAQARRDVSVGQQEGVAAIDSARAAAEQANRDLARQEQLFKDNTTPRAQLDAARATAEQAAAELRRAEAAAGRLGSTDIHLAEQNLEAARAELARAEVELRTATVYAPSSGTVLSIEVQPGERAPSGTLLTLADLSRMEAEIEVYQEAVPRLAVGKPVRLESPVLEVPLTGTIRRIGLEVGRQSLTSFESATPDSPVPFEIQGRRILSVGTFSLGGGFGGDGGLLVSEQTFFRLQPNRSSAAPSHLLLRVASGADPKRVAGDVAALLGPQNAKVAPIREAMATAARVQLKDRPTGIIFTFGVVIGIIVGIVIAYQVLATDVADHLREYATFKAMGYPHRFFVSVILEEALVLGAIGFVPGILVAQVFYNGLIRSANVPMIMTAERAVMVFVGTLVACALSGMLAIRRLKAADPADLF